MHHNQRISLLTISFVILMLLLAFCSGPQQYPDEPQIEFKQLILFDTVDLLGNKIKDVKLVFSIIDGDGNIGLKDSDTTGIHDPDSLYHNDFFTILYEIKGDDTLKIPDEKQRNFRIPYIEPQGQVKTLMADIFTIIEFSYSSGNELPYDTVFFDFYIVDRDFHISNVERTVTIRLDTIGKFPDIIDE